jgi:alpha-1,2-mannosyltransferase
VGSTLQPVGTDNPRDTSVPSGASHRRRLGLLATVVALGVAVSLRLLTARSWPLWDLEVYTEGARALLQHQDLYAVSAHGLLFTYPPFAAAAFVPLVATGGVAGSVLSLLSLVTFVVVGLVVARKLRLSRLVTAAVLIGALVLEPVIRTLVLGQVNLILMALVVLDIVVVPRRWRGLLIGVAAGIKLTPAIFLVYFVLKRDYRAAAQAVGSFLATLAIGWLVAPDASLTYWSGRVLAMGSFGDYQIEAANQSLRGTLIRLLGTPTPPALLWAVLVLGVVVLSVWAARRRIRGGDDLGAVLALALCGLLISPISWTHHWVWIVPALLYAVAHRRFLVAWVLGVVFFAAPMWLLPSGGDIELRYAWWQVAVSMTYVLIGFAGLVILGLQGRTASEAVR